MKRRDFERVVSRNTPRPFEAKEIMVEADKVVTWDPEEPLAERLEVFNGSTRTRDQSKERCWYLGTPLGPLENAGLAGDQGAEFLTPAEATLAADLYNRRKDIEKVVEGLRSTVECADAGRVVTSAGFLARLAAMLEGKA